MKYTLITWLLFTTFLIVQAGDNPFLTKQQLTSAVPVKFSENGKAALLIVLPERPTDKELVAATELKKYLDKITSADFQIVNKNSNGSPCISIGWNQAAEAAGFENADHHCSPEAFRIKIKENSIYLFGGERAGIIHAAMALLEEDLGCRWYSAGWEKIPSNPNLTVNVVPRDGKPDFEKRFVLTDTSVSANYDWAQRNRVMANNGFDHVPGWFCHTYSNIVGMEEFSARSDLFAKNRAGVPSQLQLCPSQPEVQKRAQVRMLATLRNHHAPNMLISLSQNDANGFCECAECLKWQQRYQTSMGAHLELVNRVAAVVGKEFPEIKVDFIVYPDWFRKPPGNITMEPNTAVWYCANTIPFQKYFRRAPECVQEFARWKALVPTIYIWEYGCDFGDYNRSLPTLPAKADNLRYWHEQGVRGVMLLDAFGSNGADQQALRAWVYNKLLWNCSWDADALALDFCRGVFGVAATEVFEYYQLVATAGKAEKTIEEYYGLDNFFRLADAIFARAYAKATNDTELRKRLDLQYFSIVFSEVQAIFRAYPGNRNDFPRLRYQELLRKTSRIAAEWNITNYNETTRMSGKLKEFSYLTDLEKLGGKFQTSASEVLVYEGRLRSDPTSSMGSAGMLPPSGSWLIQWHFPVNLLIPNQKYQLRAQLRLAGKSKQPEGSAFEGGVYPMTSMKIVAQKLSVHEYRWFEIGDPFLPQEKSYAWFAASNGSDAGGIWVDRMELVPAK